MKQSPKEKLNDKARKMIDLIYDEVQEGGEKEISSSFVDPKTSFKCTLTVKVNVADCREIVDPELSQIIEDMNSTQEDNS